MTPDGVHLRGSIHWVSLGEPDSHEQAGDRPAVVIQADQYNRIYNTVVIVPITKQSQWKRLPTVVPLRKGVGGLADDSFALCHQIRVLDKTKIGAYVGRLSADEMEMVAAAVSNALGMPDS